MSNKEFILAEYNQLYELVRHYASVQHQFFQMFLTVFTAVCAGYFLIQSDDSLSLLSDQLLIIGFIACLFFLALLASNRVYYQTNFMKIEFIRTRYLYTDENEWAGYPQFYPNKSKDMGPAEEHKTMRWHSAFFLRLLIVCFASSILFYLMKFPESWSVIQNCKLSATIVVFLILVVGSSSYARWKGNVIAGTYAPTKK